MAVFNIEKSFTTIPLEKKHRTLLVKLFYQSCSNCLLFCCTSRISMLKWLTKKAYVDKWLGKKIITRFAEIGKLSVQPGSGGKHISKEILEQITITVVDRASNSRYSSTNARTMSHELFIP